MGFLKIASVLREKNQLDGHIINMASPEKETRREKEGEREKGEGDGERYS